MKMNIFAKIVSSIVATTTVLAAQSFEKPTLEVDQGVGSFKWQSQQGRVYFLQFSTDLEEWEYFPSVIEPGNNQEKEWMFSTLTPKLFTRLRYTQSNSLRPEFEDFDNDGYSNFFELQITNSDPLEQADPAENDIDGDGMADSLEMLYFGNLHQDGDGDYDGDGTSNFDEIENETDPTKVPPGEGGGNGDANSGVLPIPNNSETLDHTGNGNEGAKTEDMETFSFTEGSKSFFVLVGIHSAEYPKYTDPDCTFTNEDGEEVPCEFNDIVKYTLTSPTTGNGGDEVTKTLDVNEYDEPWNNSGKAFDIGEGEKFYYFIEQKVLKNEQRSAVDMDAKVEVTNINDAFFPSGATIAVFPVQIQPKAQSQGNVGDLIISFLGKSGEKHFVSTKKNPSLQTPFIEFEATGISEEIFEEFLEWENGEMGATPLERKVSRDQVEKVELKIKIKETGEVVDLMNVWKAWSTLNGAVGAPKIKSIGRKVKIGEKIECEYNCIATIEPSSLFDIGDVPNLRGENASDPPGGQNNFGDPLSGGAKFKWDLSRRLKSTLTTNAVPAPNQALGLTFPMPADKVVGNDDASTNDEFPQNPYFTSGEIASIDTPTRDLRQQGGDIGQTWEQKLEFEEFSRVEINSKWYVLSEPDKWEFDIKYLKEAITETDAGIDFNDDGDTNDVINEADVLENGDDANMDGDTNDVWSRWVDNGTTTKN